MIETEIEVGKPAKPMTYDEAVFYCFCLGDGWRLPTGEEYMRLNLQMCWWEGQRSLGESSLGEWLVVPVRDLKDD
jgi:hypothetical protein